MRLLALMTAKRRCRQQAAAASVAAAAAATGTGMACLRRHFCATSSRKVDLLLERLRQVDTTVLCDADKAMHGLPPTPTPHYHHDSNNKDRRISLILSLHSLPTKQRSTTMVGIARTVLLSRHDDILGVCQGLLEGQRDEVLVVSTPPLLSPSPSDSESSDANSSQQQQLALAGDLFCTEAARRGMTGMMICGGGMRDSAQLAELENFRAYASFITPYAGTAQHPAKEMQCDIACGNVVVRPADVVVGDDDGVLVGSKDAFQAILPLALEIQTLEEKVRQGLWHGRTLHSMTNIEDHIQRRVKGEVSTLEFCP